MIIIASHFKKLDWILIISAFILTAIGLISIYSSSLRSEDFFDLQKQLFFWAAACALMILFSYIDYRNIRNDPYFLLILYFACIALLAGLFFFAPEIRGVKSWYKIGSLSFDPIELTKLVLIILLAKYFSVRHIELYRMRHILLSGFYVFIPSLIIFFQPNLGSALILIFLWFFILLISGIRVRQLLLLLLSGILIFGFSWQFLLKDYQKERIISFVSQDYEPLGAGWSQTQAKIAIGSAGIFGKGFGKGTQVQYGFLPETKTDFVISAIGEEFGFFGISAVLFLFLILVWRIIKISISKERNFPRLFASGFAAVLVTEILINIGMNLGLLPVIGIALPFLSYGGSGLIFTYIALGMVLNIDKTA